MSILETFFFVFDADARKLNDGINDASRASDRLENNLQDVDHMATGMGKTVLDLAGKIGFAIGSIFAVSAIADQTRQVADFVDGLNDSAEAIGVNVSALHAWDNAATMTGGSTGAFTNSLKSFNEGINSIAIKGKGLLLPFLEELGLSLADVKKGANDPLLLLTQLSDKFQELDITAASTIGSKLGLDQGTINLLREGRVGLEELIRVQRENGVVTTEQAAIAAEFNDQVDSLGFAWEDLKRRLILGIMPALTGLLEVSIKIVNWVKENRVAVVSFLTATAAVLVGVYAPAAIASAAATWALIAPFLAVAAIVAAFGVALALVVDDLYAFGQGNDSITGEIAKKWPRVGEGIKAVGEVLAWLTEGVLAFTELIAGSFTDPQAAIDAFAARINYLVGVISEQYPIVGEVFSVVSGIMGRNIEATIAVWDFLVAKIKAGVEIFKTAIDYAKSVHGAVGELFGAAPTQAAQEGREAVARGRTLLGQTNTPIASTTSSAITNSARTSNKTTTVNTGAITVQTQATDGAAVSKALADNLGTQIKGAVDQMDDGVVA